MNILSWNCWGLGNPRAVRTLTHLVRIKKPELVFIMETKLVSHKADFLKNKLGYSNSFVVDSKGRSGGLILLWHSSVKVEIQNYSRRHINAVIQRRAGEMYWKLTGFYGHPETARRPEAWALLRHLSLLSPMPWLCLGDFNEILSNGEKLSGPPRPYSQMASFQRALEDSGLNDLGFCGPQFTWCNDRSGEDFNCERLDRVLANHQWSQFFNVVNVEVLPRHCSDHNPLLVTLSRSQDIKWQKSRLFRFKAGWVKHKDHKELIKQAWGFYQNHPNKWKVLQSKLHGCRKTLQVWVRKQKPDTAVQVQNKLAELQALQAQDPPALSEEEAPVKAALNDLLAEEELKWKQRAKVSWLREGDRNTKYFHMCANQRKRKNQIVEIKDKQGNHCSSQRDIEQAFIHYFQELFLAGDAVDVEPSVEALECKVTPEMNQKLLAEFTVEEITKALNQMAPTKAPGPDGFSACFYQRNWSTIHGEVCKAILHFLNFGVLDEHINSTYIALVPKIGSPVSVTDFRPISLCNVIYKLISKVLANHLKSILPDIISYTQSAFIPGRLITDNIIAAYETLHSMQNRMWHKTGFMGLKLDMSKAYDRVEWKFLETAMQRMGFASRWIELIMACVTSVSYSVLVNGNPVGCFKPSRGLRQSDPISPYLFLLCAETLSSLLFKAENKGFITGVPTSPRGPRLSHLFFADDSLLFCKANLVEWRRLIKILGVYEAGLGQKLNLQKTSLFFSRNTTLARKEEIVRLSGISEASRLDTYLGVPAWIGKNKGQAFKEIVERVRKKLSDWKVKYLSQAGKEILLKAVVQAIPTYAMSVFQLPNSLCLELNRMMQNFWWGHMEKSSKIHWCNWEKLGKSKATGGSWI